jgi:hypothetical protein
MLRCGAYVRAEVSEELSASVIRVTRIGELVPTLAVTSNRAHFVFLRSVRRLLVRANVPRSPILVTLMMEALRSSETLVLTTATRRIVPEDASFHSSLCLYKRKISARSTPAFSELPIVGRHHLMVPGVIVILPKFEDAWRWRYLDVLNIFWVECKFESRSVAE